MATRQSCQDVAAALTAQGVRASFYHAGMNPAERDLVQVQFMNDDSEVIVATTAFDVGITKPNVRFVFHHGISDSIDAPCGNCDNCDAGRVQAQATAAPFAQASRVQHASWAQAL